MTDQIIEIEAQEVIESTNEDSPEETTTKDGMNIPDPTFVDEVSPEGLKQIEDRRKELADIPPFPVEWQQGYANQNKKGFSDAINVPITKTTKQKEVNKLIKKYKRYIKNNVTEIRRLDGAPQYDNSF